jgi:gliding motility-associated-like protein
MRSRLIFFFLISFTCFFGLTAVANSFLLLDSTEVVQYREGGGENTSEKKEPCNPFSAEFQPEHCHCRVFVPNSFTPNADNLNDRFFIYNSCAFEEIEMVIYNRWGEEIFRTQNVEEGWNGKKGGELLPQDAYVWIIHYTSIDVQGRTKHQKRGLIRLIR